MSYGAPQDDDFVVLEEEKHEVRETAHHGMTHLFVHEPKRLRSHPNLLKGCRDSGKKSFA